MRVAVVPMPGCRARIDGDSFPFPVPHVCRKGYDAVALLMSDLRMLARADVFSGTFSSNVGRMVTLMRKSLGKPRSAVAADKKRWRSG